MTMQRDRRRAPHPSEILKEISLTDYLSPLDYLKRLYEKTKAQSFSYSYLDFAQDLGFSRSNVLRLMLIGQRPLTIKSAERIVEALNLSGMDKRYFIILAKHEISRLPHERDLLFRELVQLKTRKNPRELSPAQAEYFSEWYHPVIRELIHSTEFNGKPEWIQEQLHFSLRIDQIKKSLELLSQLGYIILDEQTNQWKKSEAHIVTDDEVDSLALIRYHQKMIEMGKESIIQVDEDQREIRAATLFVPSHLMPILKTKVAGWIQEMLAFEQNSSEEKSKQDLGNANHKTAHQVVQVNVQLFAFTQGGKKKMEGQS